MTDVMNLLSEGKKDEGDDDEGKDGGGEKTTESKSDGK